MPGQVGSCAPSRVQEQRPLDRQKVDNLSTIGDAQPYAMTALLDEGAHDRQGLARQFVVGYEAGAEHERAQSDRVSPGGLILGQETVLPEGGQDLRYLTLRNFAALSQLADTPACLEPRELR